MQAIQPSTQTAAAAAAKKVVIHSCLRCRSCRPHDRIVRCEWTRAPSVLSFCLVLLVAALQVCSAWNSLSLLFVVVSLCKNK